MTAVAREGRDDLPVFIHRELDDYGLNCVEFRVYGRIARRAGESGRHFESAAKMAAEFEVSLSTIRRALKVLVLCRLVHKEVQPGKPTVYRLLPKREWAGRETVAAAREIALHRDSEGVSPQTGVGVSPEVGVEGPRCVTRERGGVSPEVGVGVSPEITEGTPSEGTPPKVHTHTARERDGESADAGVRVGRSRHSYELRKAYAAEKGLGSGWLELSRDGRYDDSEQLLEWLEARRLAREEGVQPVKPKNLMSFTEAVRHVDSVLSVNVATDREGLISALNADDSVKNLLRLRYLAPAARDPAVVPVMQGLKQ